MNRRGKEPPDRSKLLPSGNITNTLKAGKSRISRHSQVIRDSAAPASGAPIGGAARTREDRYRKFSGHPSQ